MMRKLLYSLLVIPMFLMAGLDIPKVNKVLMSLKSLTPLKFYNANKSIDLDDNLHFTSFENANIILFSNGRDKNKLAIVNSYKELRRSKNNIGAIYVKKGRTQIIFIEERLLEHGLSLPSSFQKNLLSECQLNPLCLLEGIK